MKVLVIQQRMGIGDMVIFLSYIHAIAKKENCPVSILVKENSRADEFLNQDKHIDKIILLDRKRNDTGKHSGILGFFKLAKELKKEKYEKVYIFNSSLRYALLARFAHITNIIQYPLFKKRGQNVIQTAKKFTEEIVGNTVSSQPKIFVDEKMISKAKTKYTFSKEFKHICVGLSASGPTKRWDIDRFISTFEKISKDRLCKFYLAGGVNDSSLLNKFINSSLGKNSVSFENMSIRETLPIISNCNLYVGNDTGWLHLSCALGLKCVALFMDSPVLAYGKYSNNINIIVPEGETEETTAHNTRGKDKITVEQVVQKAKEFLN